jgi:hypothetical protein
MTTHTSTGKGLSKPHKMERPTPGIGSNLANAKSISSSEKSMNKKIGSGGLPSTYYGNSRACNTEGEK